MIRFLHTADWQMGMLASGLGAAADAVRAARIESLRNVFDLAKDRGVQAVLVAGDLFEDNHVAGSVVEQVAGLLNDHTRLPTYIIPGNHDPYTRDSVYRRPVWTQLREHVRLLTRSDPAVLAPDAVLFPCPLHLKNSMDDPTACIAQGGGGQSIRVGLAHGTMRIRDGVGDDYFPIPLDAPQRHALDYLALGHWHSTLAHPTEPAHARACYSGTHETTRFGERDSGNSLLVTIDAPGAPPEVEVVRTGVLHWEDYPIDLDRTPLDQAAKSLREWSEPRRCLLRITLTGELSAEAAGQLGDLLGMVHERFLYASVDDSGLRPTGAADELFSAPYLRETAAALEALSVQGSAFRPGEQGGARPLSAVAPSVRPEVARRALQILRQAAWSTRK